MGMFRDAGGRDWDVKISVSTLRDLREIDFHLMGDLTAALSKLAEDPVLLCDVLYIVCRDQVRVRELSDRDFGELLVGDVIENATEALLDGVINFIPSARGRLLRMAVDRSRPLVAQEEAKIEAEINSWTLPTSTDSPVESVSTQDL